MRVTLLLCFIATTALAQSTVVSPRPELSEIGRYQMLALDVTDMTLKIDTMTGSTWKLCPVTEKDKKAALSSKWCPLGTRAPLLAGPIGRYVLHTDNAARKAPTVFMMDTVSGRSWMLCNSPVPDKMPGWCPLEPE